MAHRLPRRTLEVAFGSYLLLVSLRFVVIGAVMSADIPTAQLGPDGILAGMRSKTALAMLSTTSSDMFQSIASQMPADVHLVDCSLEPIGHGVRTSGITGSTVPCPRQSGGPPQQFPGRRSALHSLPSRDGDPDFDFSAENAAENKIAGRLRVRRAGGRGRA